MAERQTLRLLGLLDQSYPAVDLQLLTELPRLEVRLASSLPMSGFSSWESSRWLIAINADDHPLRQRFTLAHEFKHVLDHPFIRCLYPGPDGRPSEKRAESICDYFAGCLLMPRPWVKRTWTEGVQDAPSLAAHFGVSLPAMKVRLQQLGLILPRPRCGWVQSRGRAFLRPDHSGRTVMYERALAGVGL
ncbi:MAG: ImmA/IrrE family metallo-endopeptidase [Actinomycetota bacterium]